MKKLVLFFLVIGALYIIISRTPDRAKEASTGKDHLKLNLIFGPAEINTEGEPKQLLISGNDQHTVVAWLTTSSSTVTVAYIDEAGDIDKTSSFDAHSPSAKLSALAVNPSGLAVLTWYTDKLQPLTVAGVQTVTSSQQLVKAVVSHYGSVVDSGTVVDEAVDTSGLKQPNWSAITLHPETGFQLSWYNSQTYKLENGNLVPTSWGPRLPVPANKKPAVVKEIGQWEIYQGQPAVYRQNFTLSGEPYGKKRVIAVGFKPNPRLSYPPLKQVDAIKVNGDKVYTLSRVVDSKPKKTPNGTLLPERLWLGLADKNKQGKKLVAVCQKKLLEKDATEGENFTTLLTANTNLVATIWSTVTDDWQFLTFSHLFNQKGNRLTEIPLLLSVDKKVQAQMTENNVLAIASASKIDLGLSLYKTRKKAEFLRVPEAAKGIIQTVGNNLLLAWPSTGKITVYRWQINAD